MSKDIPSYQHPAESRAERVARWVRPEIRIPVFVLIEPSPGNKTSSRHSRKDTLKNLLLADTFSAL